MMPHINFYDVSLIDCDFNGPDERTASGRGRGLTFTFFTKDERTASGLRAG